MARDGYDDDLEDYDDEPPKGRSGQREVLDIIPERYDNDSDSRTAKKSAHTRLILTVALVLLAIAALGVAARQIFVPDPGAPMPMASAPTITPDQNPIRAKPENPGGMDVPNQDKLIYDRMASGANEPVRETLLPPAEQPAAPPVQPRPQATIKPAFDAPQPQSAPTTAQNVPPAPTPAPREAVLPEPVAPPPPPPPPIVTPPSAQPQGIVPPTPIVTPPAPQVQPTPIVPPTPAPAKPEPAKPAASSTGGGWVAQLAALKTESAAASEWSRISRANSDILGGYSSDVLRVDLGAKGIFWRLRAGPMDEARARSVCAELKKRGQGCIVARK